MIQALRRALFTVHYPYQNIVEQQRARILVIINMLSLMGASLWVLMGLINSLLNPDAPFLTTVAVIFLPALFLLIHILVQRGYLTTGAWIYVASLMAVTAFAMTQGLQGNADLSLFLTLIAGVVILDRRSNLIVMFLLVATVLVGVSAQNSLTSPVTVIHANNTLRDFLAIIMTLSVGFLILYLFSNQLSVLTESSKEDLDHFQQLSAYMTEVISFEDDDEDRAIARMLSFCMRDLGFSYAQFFHANPEGVLIRRVRTGFGVQIAADISDVIEIGEGNAVFQAARSRLPQMTSYRDMVPRRRHFLPTTTFGIVIPVMYHGALVGVLDVQNNRDREFTAEEVQLVSHLAQGVGMVVNVVREIYGLRNELRQEKLTRDSRRSPTGGSFLQEQRQAESLWDPFRTAQDTSAYGLNFSGQDGVFIAANDLPADMLQVIKENNLHIEQLPDKQIVTVPIRLNRNVLGAMAFTLPKTRKLSERQVEMVEIIARRLALALENRRLLERTQSQAERERKANETANELIGSTDVRSLLELAAGRFNDVLGAVNTRIEVQLNSEPSEETA
jgi:GAF domain-containing protein